MRGLNLKNSRFDREARRANQESKNTPLKIVRSGSFNQKSFDRRHNVSLVVISVIGVAIIALGFWQISSSLKVPLPDVPGGQILPPSQAEVEDLSAKTPQELKKVDTDEDGLSDFDEIWVYATSPYLADSDSDGISDYDEIMDRTDPGCSEGQTCFTSTEGAELIENTQVETSPNTAEGKKKPLDVTAEELRSVLVQSGQFTKEQIDQVTDEELMSVYNQTLADNPDLKNSEASESESSSAVEQLSQVSASEVRQLLISQGMDESILNQFDDQALMTLYKEALAEAEAAN